MRQTSTFLTGLIGFAAVLLSGCEAGGVGDPCIPEDEYRPQFGSFAVTEVNVESRSFQCRTRVCLVANFQGRVSCPYGQTADEAMSAGKQCYVPGTDGTQSDDQVVVPVRPQLIARRPDDAVYCSCRCDGEDAPEGTLCECPSGFQCKKLVDKVGTGDEQLAGSYCVKDGTYLEDPNEIAGGPECTPRPGNNAEDGICGRTHPYGIGQAAGQ